MRTAIPLAAGFAVVALVMAACGRSADSAASDRADSGEPVSSGPATGTIEVWAMGTEGEKLADFADAFEKQHPEADVKVTPVPWEAAHDKLATAIAANETPDVGLIGTTWMGEFAAAGGLAPTPEGLVDQSAFFPGAWDTTVVEGTSYGLPWYVDTRALFYRTDIAEKAGWDKPPASWEELQRFAADMQQDGGAKHGIYLQPGQQGSWQTYLPFAWSNGAEVFDGNGYTVDTEEAAEALRYFRSFFDKHLSPATVPESYQQDFVDGDIASFISGPWEMAAVEEMGGKGFADKYDAAPLPSPSTGVGTSFVGGGNLAVFDAADNKDAAWKFVAWLTEPGVQQQWYETVGGLPSVQNAWRSGTLAEDPILQVFGEQLDSTEAPPSVPTWEQVAAVLDSDIEKVVKGDLPVDDALKHAQQRATSIGTGF